MLVLINDWKVEAMEQVDTALSIFTFLLILIIIHLFILAIIIHIDNTADHVEAALSIRPTAGFSFIIVIVIHNTIIVIIVIMIVLRWRQPYQYCLLLDSLSSLSSSST